MGLAGLALLCLFYDNGWALGGSRWWRSAEERFLGMGSEGGEVYGAGGKELAVWETVRYARDVGE